MQKHPACLCGYLSKQPEAMKRWEEGLSGLGILPSNCNKGGLAEGIPFRKILRSRNQADKTRRQEEGLREKQNKMEELG